MDDIPSGAAKSITSVNEQHGIFDVASDFAKYFRQIVRGVNSVRPAGIDPEDWKDVKQSTYRDAWDVHRSDPEYFARGSALHWARQVASHRRLDLERNKRRHAIRDHALQRELLAGHYDAIALDQILDRIIGEERRQKITQAFQVMTPRVRAVAVARLVKGLSRRETATILGLSERVVKRDSERARRELALELSDWNPRVRREQAPHEGGVSHD